MDDWRSRVVDIVVDILRDNNAGRVPSKIADWCHVCSRLGCDLAIIDAAGKIRACLMDDVLAVRSAATEHQTCMRIAHEVAEYLLVSDHSGPYRYVPGASTDQADRHAIAKMIEHCIPDGYECPGLPSQPTDCTVGARPQFTSPTPTI